MCRIPSSPKDVDMILFPRYCFTPPQRVTSRLPAKSRNAELLSLQWFASWKLFDGRAEACTLHILQHFRYCMCTPFFFLHTHASIKKHWHFLMSVVSHLWHDLVHEDFSVAQPDHYVHISPTVPCNNLFQRLRFFRVYSMPAYTLRPVLLSAVRSRRKGLC